MTLLEMIDSLPYNDNTIARIRNKIVAGEEVWHGEAQIVKDKYERHIKPLDSGSTPLPLDTLKEMYRWGVKNNDQKVMTLASDLALKSKRGNIPTESDLRDWGWLVLTTWVKV